MNRNIPLIIARAGNGYTIRPLSERKETSIVSDLFVFQDKGIASPERDNQETKDTLFGFLDLHFSDNEKDYNRSLE